MAVQKNISYLKNGVLYNTTITIDLEKLAYVEGASPSDEEQVYLKITAPGIPASGIWRRNIDGLVEDGIFASGVSSRFTAPNSGLDLGVNLTASGVFTVNGIVRQLRSIS